MANIGFPWDPLAWTRSSCWDFVYWCVYFSACVHKNYKYLRSASTFHPKLPAFFWPAAVCCVTWQPQETCGGGRTKVPWRRSNWHAHLTERPGQSGSAGVEMITWQLSRERRTPESAQHAAETHRDRLACREWIQREGKWLSAPRCELICLSFKAPFTQSLQWRPKGVMGAGQSCSAFETAVGGSNSALTETSGVVESRDK